MRNPTARPALALGRARRLGRPALLLIASLALAGGVFTAAPADANTAQANTTQANTSQPNAAPGANLLLNANATVGATSSRGWDAVTIPGRQS